MTSFAAGLYRFFSLLFHLTNPLARKGWRILPQRIAQSGNREIQAKSFKKLLYTLLLLGYMAEMTFAQDPAAGLLPFSTHTFGIDLATSNITFSVPIRSKPDFNFSLISNSHAYDELGLIHVNYGLTGSDGWLGAGLSQRYSIQHNLTCKTYKDDARLSNYSIIDPAGAAHSLSPSLYGDIYGCWPFPSTPQFATDGSGYSASSSTGYLITDIYDRAGNHYTINAGGTASLADPDGNVSTYNPSTGAFYDELDTTTPSLTESTSSMPETYSFTDASGNTQTFTVNYSGYYQWTAFSNSTCSQITDIHGSTLIYVPTSITTPTATWSFAYEQSPGQSSSYIPHLCTGFERMERG